jgi:hypothetical protein
VASNHHKVIFRTSSFSSAHPKYVMNTLVTMWDCGNLNFEKDAAYLHVRDESWMNIPVKCIPCIINEFFILHCRKFFVGNRHSSPSLLSCSFQVTGREISVLISIQFHSLFRRFSYFNVVSVRFVESLENDLTVRAKTTEMKITDFSSGSYATVFKDEVFYIHCIHPWIVPYISSCHFCIRGLRSHLWVLG